MNSEWLYLHKLSIPLFFRPSHFHRRSIIPFLLVSLFTRFYLSFCFFPSEVKTADTMSTTTEIVFASPTLLGSPIANVTSIFSDIDGTIVHYPRTMREDGYRLCEPDELNSSACVATVSCERLATSYVSGRRASGKECELHDRLAQLLAQQTRADRFAILECEHWIHEATGVVLPMYRVFNLTLGGALISQRSIALAELLQQEPFNVELTLLTGARTSTFENRRRSGVLPRTSFDVCEGGGKMWRRVHLAQSQGHSRESHPECSTKNNSNGPAEKWNREYVLESPESHASPLEESWVNRFMKVTGPIDVPPSERHGPLWDVYALLEKEGFSLDSRDMSTTFLIDITRSPAVNGAASERRFSSCEEAEEYLKEAFVQNYTPKYGVHLFMNLNKGQVNAIGCGKKEAMLFILEQRGKLASEAVALFDDENDLPFAEECGCGILPSVSHRSVLNALETERGDAGRPIWHRAPLVGPLGTEWALEQIALFKLHRTACSSVSEA